MGTVFGRTGVAEPAYEVLHRHTHGGLAYEVRRYGPRFAARASFGRSDDNGTPFRLLARYIGVFGSPENDGAQPLAMTAPVVMKDAATNKKEEEAEAKPTTIAMTAPVIMKTHIVDDKSDSAPTRTMDFILPAELDALDKIPRPTNPAVTIHALPPQVGVAHRYSGSMGEQTARTKSQALAKQLQADGLPELTEAQVLEAYEYWGFNPPFTLPMFRRNEVWLPLEEAQVAALMAGTGGAAAAEN